MFIMWPLLCATIFGIFSLLFCSHTSNAAVGSGCGASYSASSCKRFCLGPVKISCQPSFAKRSVQAQPKRAVAPVRSNVCDAAGSYMGSLSSRKMLYTKIPTRKRRILHKSMEFVLPVLIIPRINRQTNIIFIFHHGGSMLKNKMLEAFNKQINAEM